MTEIALVADLHGNLPAVEALDQDLRRRGIENIWCLGDVVGKGPNSPETMDWALARCQVLLRGNWDEGIGARQFPRDEFYYRQLGDARMRKLLEFPLEHHFLCPGRKIRLLHGRPLLPKAYYVQAEDALFLPFFQPDFQALGYADVHRQGLRIIDGAGLLFNTGSVGNGLGVPQVQYAILRGELNAAGPGPLDISLVTLPYDRARALADTDRAEREGLVNAEAFRQEIRTGRYAR